MGIKKYSLIQALSVAQQAAAAKINTILSVNGKWINRYKIKKCLPYK